MESRSKDGAISQIMGELAGEFFSPYVPLDQGFSFYDAYSKISIMEFEGEEFSVFEEYKPTVETINPIEEEEAIGKRIKQETTQRIRRRTKS